MGLRSDPARDTRPVKVDFKKSHDAYRARAGEFRVVEVPRMRYLIIDGRGDPNTSQKYADALASLYPVAYGLKFTSRRELDRDYVVPPLEALWWAADMTSFTSARDKSQWCWTAMIMTPDWLTEQMFADAVSAAAAKQRGVRLEDVRLESLEEGLCVQTLHVGSYDDEVDVLAEMHGQFVPGAGLRMTGSTTRSSSAMRGGSSRRGCARSCDNLSSGRSGCRVGPRDPPHARQSSRHLDRNIAEDR